MDAGRLCTYDQTNRYPDRIATPAAAPVQHGHTSEAPIYQRVPGTSPSHNQLNITILTKLNRGRLVQDRTSTIKSNPKPPKLNCRNWECGVIVPVSESEKKPDDEVKEGGGMLDVFRGTVPVPMSVPGKKYEGDARLKPWYFMEGMSSGFGF